MFCLFEQVNDAKTVSIRNFNADLMEDKRVSISMVSLIPCIFKPKKVSHFQIQLGYYFQFPDTSFMTNGH